MGVWRTATFIRHNCGERKNTVGHRWFRITPFLIKYQNINFQKTQTCALQKTWADHYCTLKKSCLIKFKPSMTKTITLMIKQNINNATWQITMSPITCVLPLRLLKRKIIQLTLYWLLRAAIVISNFYLQLRNFLVLEFDLITLKFVECNGKPILLVHCLY